MPVLTEEKKRTGGVIVPPRWPDQFGGDGNDRPEDSGSGFPLSKAQIGMWVLLTAVVMLFAGLSSAFIVLRGIPTWQNIEVPRLLWLNTVLLVFSSFALETARHGRIKLWVGISGILGVSFLIGQVVAWRQLVAAGVYLQSTLHSSFFYILTGIHGIHLVGGLVGLAIVFYRRRPESLRVCALDWHFMGAIWLYLFLFIMLA
jgi:cytochrome c oxidase subunit 3